MTFTTGMLNQSDRYFGIGWFFKFRVTFTYLGASDFKFDNVFAMALPESKVVAAGTKYQADMFISASSKAIRL